MMEWMHSCASTVKIKPATYAAFFNSLQNDVEIFHCHLKHWLFPFVVSHTTPAQIDLLFHFELLQCSFLLFDNSIDHSPIWAGIIIICARFVGEEENTFSICYVYSTHFFFRAHVCAYKCCYTCISEFVRANSLLLTIIVPSKLSGSPVNGIWMFPSLKIIWFLRLNKQFSWKCIE